MTAAPAVAGEKSEGSPWAYLQKTYSNMDEAEQCTSETKGQHDCLQEDRPSCAELHTAGGAALPVQVGNTQPAQQQCMTLTKCATCVACSSAGLLLKDDETSRPTCLWLIAVSLQAGSIPMQSQTNGPGVWSRNVPENAWGDASAVSSPAALPDAVHSVHKQPSVITSVQAQVSPG